MKSLPVFKSHYSLGKSILTTDKPNGKINYDPVSIIDLALHAKLKQVVLVEDNMTSFLEAHKNCQDNDLSLIFGLRISVTKNVLAQDESSLKSRSKYIIFARGNAGYQALIKIWSFAAKEGFYYNACIDFENLKRFWHKDLMLVVPFYDSFLHLNAFFSHFHVPDFSKLSPTFFLERNDLPFDEHLRKITLDYCSDNGYPYLEASSIYYRSKKDFIAYLTFRCISERTTIEKPEFNHMGSDSFNFDRWLKENE